MNHRMRNVADAGVIVDIQAAAKHVALKAQWRTLAFFTKHLG